MGMADMAIENPIKVIYDMLYHINFCAQLYQCNKV